MENNLLNNAKAFFNEDTLSKLSGTVGVDSAQLKQGTDLVIPALFLGLQRENENGLNTILEQAKSHFGNFDFQQWFNSDGSAPAGGAAEDVNSQHPEHQHILQSIFGDKLDTVVSAISGFIGIKSDTIQKLLSSALPAVFASLTNNGTNWNAAGISNLLNENKSNFAAALPAGLGLGAFGSLFADSDIQSPAVETPIPPADIPVVEPPVLTVPPVNPEPAIHTREAVREVKKSSGLWWILIPLVLVALWFLFGKSCAGNGAGTSDSTSNGRDTSSMTNPADSLGAADGLSNRESVILKLPDGQELRAYPRGIEDNLIKFLQSDYKALPDDTLKNKWFDFDNLNFETGTAKILPASRDQLLNLAAILKVFPDAKVKIGGYTDKTGDEAFNKKLSLDRANAVKVFLDEQGLGAQVAGTEGYGSEIARYPADAPESDRIKDRRVSVSVRK
ncbi:DUF937 domain-containing protein [Sphingobacterium spiritivorum]|uniref:DUF937 domain-containing protein n=1 Tax=Sphingobacterium spiritivorum TaxID=258 RepID=UPI003DA2F4CA